MAWRMLTSPGQGIPACSASCSWNLNALSAMGPWPPAASWHHQRDAALQLVQGQTVASRHEQLLQLLSGRLLVGGGRHPVRRQPVLVLGGGLVLDGDGVPLRRVDHPGDDLVHLVQGGHLAAKARDLQLPQQHLQPEHFQGLDILLLTRHQT